MPETIPHIDLDLFTWEGQPPDTTTAEHEDVPELTEVVEHHEIPAIPAVPARANREAGEDRIQDTVWRKTPVAPSREALDARLSKAVSDRLQAEVPTLVEAALQAAFPAIAEEIRRGVENIARDAIRDFMNRPVDGNLTARRRIPE
jgi:hypothetical protein